MTPRVRASMLAVSLILSSAACSSRGEVPQAAEPTTSTSITASATPPGTPGGAGPSRSADPSPSGSLAPAPPPPGRAPASAPAAAGTYRYRQTGATTFGTFTLKPDPEGTLVISPATIDAQGQHQKQERTYSQGRAREQGLLFTSEAILLEYTTTKFGTQSQTCRTDRPIEVVRLPFEVGRSWASSGRCSGGQIALVGKVLREEARTVDGTRVQTYVVQHTISFTADSLKQTTEMKSWMSPAYRLIVHSEQTSRGTVEGTDFTDELTDDLISLTPA